MFGFSFGEVFVVVLVGLIIVGPRQLPLMMRTVGQWIGKIRRMAFDMREQSGIDEILRLEGLEKDIRQLQSLVKGNVFDALSVDLDAEIKAGARTNTERAAGSVSANDDLFLNSGNEYPIAGCDSYGAIAEDVEPYTMAYDASAPLDTSAELQASADVQVEPRIEPSAEDPNLSEKRSDG